MSTAKYQTGTRKPVNPELTLKPDVYLSKYDLIQPERKDPNVLGFRVYPSMQVPGPIKQFIKRKQEKGLNHLDGPTSLTQSLFMQSLEFHQ